MKVKRSLILVFILISLILPCLAGCADDKILAKPEDTSLEFWVTENVTSEDFKDHYSVDGVFGGYMYFGKGYQQNEITEENYDIQPEHCVTYTVTAYPDYSSDNGKFDTVTRIQITDPQISVYGITCNSSLQEFNEAFKNLGCTIERKGPLSIATYGKVKVALASYDDLKMLTVWVEVTNKKGIIF